MKRYAMTMTAERRAVFARQARARFDKGERKLTAVAMDALTQYLAHLRDRLALAPVALAAAPPEPAGAAAEAFTAAQAADLLDLLDDQGIFGAILDRTIMPALKLQLADVLAAGMGHPGAQSSLIAWRNQWLADRRQELVHIPDAITDQLRTALRGAAAVNGTTVDDARLLAQNMLDDGYPSWEGRAQLIARTETVGANNQGALASFSAIAESQGAVATKTWLATNDERTRQDHADVDGTTVGISEMFDVGGESMSGPGDPAGDAGQVCNCRCVADITAIEALSVSAAFRRYYAGPMVRLETASGNVLTVTPNHPILTVAGWTEAGALTEGDEVIAGSLRERVTLGDPDVPNMPASAAQLFDALALTGTSERARTAPVDFHGDGTDGEVEVTRADDVLTAVSDRAGVEHGRQLILTASHTAVGVPSDRASLLGVSHAEGLGSGAVALLDALPVQRADHGGSADAEQGGDSLDRLAFVESGDAGSIGEYTPQPPALGPSAKHAVFDEHAPDRRGADAVLAREGLDAYAGQVFADQLIAAERFTFAGHVYNFSTRESAYIAGGIVAHNCTMTYDFPEQQQGDGSGDASASDGTGAGEVSAEDQAAAQDGVVASAGDSPGVALMLGLGITSEQELAVPGANPDPPGLHCTVAYLGEKAAEVTPEQRAALLTALAGLAPEGTADAFATAAFNPNDPEREPCAVVLVQSAWLADFRAQVQAAISQAGLSEADTFPIWIPHVALAFNVDTSVIPPGAVGGEVDFNRLVVGFGGEQIIVAGEGAVDPGGQTDAVPLAAAMEAPVTAPTTDAPPVAVGGDTAATPDAPAAALDPCGVTWSGPVALLDTPASDGRRIYSGGGTIRPLPQPLSWQREADDEHDGAVMVGRVLAVEVRGEVLWASGDYLDPMLNFDAQQAMAQVDAGLGFVSVDLAVQAIGFCDPEGNALDPALYDGDTDVQEVALAWEFGGATIVSFAAFADARITNEVPAMPPMASGPPVLEVPVTATFAGATPEVPAVADDGTITLDDGSTVGVGDTVGVPGPDGMMDCVLGVINTDGTVTVTPPVMADGTQPADMTVNVADLVASPEGSGKPGMEGEAALIAAASGEPYTAAYFRKRELPGPTPLTVNRETGEVFGHLSQWSECHVGKLAETGRCITPPREPGDDYSYFNITPLPTDEGVEYVGRVTVGTGHAGPRGGFRGAVEHYDHSGTQAAVVKAYADEHGTQVAGQVIHGLDPAKVEELALSPLSGDWRQTVPHGPLRLVAALGVNVPGFAVRPVIGMVGNEQVSLVASGVVARGARTLSEIVLPSGRTIAVDDFQAMTAAMIEALGQRNATPPSIDELGQRRIKARLALAGRRRSVS